jgi:hypothetical protein
LHARDKRWDGKGPHDGRLSSQNHPSSLRVPRPIQKAKTRDFDSSGFDAEEMKGLALFSMLLFTSSAHGQLRLDGGTSTLFQGSGAEATMYSPGNTASASIGYHNGFIFGASDTFISHDTKITVGDETLGFSFDGVGLGLALKGVSASRVWKNECSHPKPARRLGPAGYLGSCGNKTLSLTAFVGATGAGFFTPFATVTQTQHLGTGALLQYQVRNLTLSSLDVIEGGKHSLAQGGSYSSHYFRLSGSGGLLNSQKYFSGSATFQPIRSWSLYANHQSYFIPYAAKGDSVGTSLNIGRFSGTAALNQSTSLGRRITGENIGAGVRVGFVRENSSWYKSTGQKTLLVHTITEMMRHWTLTQAINQAAGRNSYSFGGGYSGNRISVSVSHSVQFLLNGKGYQQTTSVQISFRIHDTVVTAQTVTDPFGKTQYSAYAQSYVQTSLQAAGHETRSNGGKYVLSGVVKDENGQPVAGACMRINKEIVYSNESGVWSLRSHHNKPEPVTVLVDEFQLGTWQVIAAPAAAKPGEPVTITVAREK